MKKKYLFLLFILSFSLLPFVVSAKEVCKVISGNGKDLGSEIACGSEHFYVLSSDEKQTRMLAKYNLYTGYIIERVPIENNNTSIYYYCEEKAYEMGGTQKSYNTESLILPEGIYPDLYCYIEKEIVTDHILQSEEAIGAHVDEDGEYLYPQIGDNYLKSGHGGYQSDDRVTDPDVVYDDPNFSDFIIQFEYSVSGEKLLGYKTSLEEMGYEILNIDLLSLSEIDQIVYDKTNKRLPLTEWAQSVRSKPRYNVEGVFGDLKQLVPDEYKWLYSTTYWNKTSFYATNTYNNYYFMFVGSMGKLCAAGSQLCGYQTTLGCGIRPVVTISNDIIVDERVPERDIVVNPETKSNIFLLISLLIINLIIISILFKKNLNN